MRSASVKAPAAGSDLSAHKSPSQESPSDTIPGVTSIGEVLLTMQAGRSIDQALAAEARSILEQVQLEIWATGKNLDGFTPVHARKLGEMLLAVGGSLDDVRKAAKRFINRKCRSGATAIGNPGGYWGKMLVGVCQTYNPHAQWPADAPPPGSEPRKSPR